MFIGLGIVRACQNEEGEVVVESQTIALGLPSEDASLEAFIEHMETVYDATCQ
ncbi:MAG: hypothetical protein AAF985_17825 [Bacteroidota bacterium]